MRAQQQQSWVRGELVWERKAMNRAGQWLLIFLGLAMVGFGCGPKQPEPDPKKVVEKAPVDPLMAKSAQEWLEEGAKALSQSPPDYELAQISLENSLKREADYLPAIKELAVLYEKTEAYTEALSSYQRLAELQPDEARHHVSMGRVLLQQQQINEALEAYRNALTREVKCFEAYNGMAMAYVELGEFEQAEKMAKEVLVEDSTNTQALNTLGMLYRRQKRPALAKFVFERALESKPENPELLNNLGLLALERDDYTQAVSYFTSAIESDSTQLAPRLNLGAVYLSFLDYPAALEQFEAAYALAPTDSAAHLGYAASLYGNGQFEKAAASYESYAEKNPGTVQAAQRLARLYERNLNNPEKACHWYTELVKLKPEDKDAAVMKDFICKSSAKE